MIPSLPKLLGLIIIIWLVWTAFRLYESRKAAILEKEAKSSDEIDAGNGKTNHKRSEEDCSVELRECKICLAWVSGESCGRENCPY